MRLDQLTRGQRHPLCQGYVHELRRTEQL
jgi:hypothetical protein